jgi:hypothetical protein
MPPPPAAGRATRFRCKTCEEEEEVVCFRQFKLYILSNFAEFQNLYAGEILFFTSCMTTNSLSSRCVRRLRAAAVPASQNGIWRMF